jgi:hypothetical protein
MLSSNLILAIKKHAFERNFTKFCVDNCNTDFAGVKRRGESSVNHQLKKKDFTEKLWE